MVLVAFYSQSQVVLCQHPARGGDACTQLNRLAHLGKYQFDGRNRPQVLVKHLGQQVAELGRFGDESADHS